MDIIDTAEKFSNLKNPPIMEFKFMSAEEETIRMAVIHTSATVGHMAAASAQLDEIVDAIPRIHAAYMSILTAGSKTAAVTKELVPAVPVKKSVTPDYIICLEDGKKFKSMRRHLSKLGMTPEQYREKWGLPSDYPIVAASYSAKRSQMAKDNGLGKKK